MGIINEWKQNPDAFLFCCEFPGTGILHPPIINAVLSVYQNAQSEENKQAALIGAGLLFSILGDYVSSWEYESINRHIDPREETARIGVASWDELPDISRLIVKTQLQQGKNDIDTGKLQYAKAIQKKCDEGMARQSKKTGKTEDEPWHWTPIDLSKADW
jgi:hypothetical protein